MGKLIIPKLTYKFKTVPIKIPVVFRERVILILKFPGLRNSRECLRNILQKGTNSRKRFPISLQPFKHIRGIRLDGQSYSVDIPEPHQSVNRNIYHMLKEASKTKGIKKTAHKLVSRKLVICENIIKLDPYTYIKMNFICI